MPLFPSSPALHQCRRSARTSCIVFFAPASPIAIHPAQVRNPLLLPLSHAPLCVSMAEAHCRARPGEVPCRSWSGAACRPPEIAVPLPQPRPHPWCDKCSTHLVSAVSGESSLSIPSPTLLPVRLGQVSPDGTLVPYFLPMRSSLQRSRAPAQGAVDSRATAHPCAQTSVPYSLARLSPGSTACSYVARSDASPAPPPSTLVLRQAAPAGLLLASRRGGAAASSSS
jgi:hypothetical protein